MPWHVSKKEETENLRLCIFRLISKADRRSSISKIFFLGRNLFCIWTGFRPCSIAIRAYSIITASSTVHCWTLLSNLLTLVLMSKEVLKFHDWKLYKKNELSPITLLVIQEFPYYPKPSPVRKCNPTSAVLFRAAKADAEDIPKGSHGGLNP